MLTLKSRAGQQSQPALPGRASEAVQALHLAALILARFSGFVPWAGSREAAVEKFKAYLAGNAALLAKIPGLEGRKIMCHCNIDEVCHGDVLISEFRRLELEATSAPTPRPPADEEALGEALGLSLEFPLHHGVPSYDPRGGQRRQHPEC